MVVTEERVTAEQERQLRELHDEIPTRPGHWPHDLEGSYAPRADLETLAALDRQWLYVNRGAREMEWSTHCNTEDVRWTLRERGITLVGPEPRPLVAEVPADVLRSRMPPLIESFLSDLLSWTSFDIAWAQRYAVTTLCRMLTRRDRRSVVEAGLAGLGEGRFPRSGPASYSRRRRPALPWNDAPRPGSVEATSPFPNTRRNAPPARCLRAQPEPQQPASAGRHRGATGPGRP